MSPSSWVKTEVDGSPQPSQHHLDDEQMVRHLASRYSATELARLFQNAGVRSRRSIPDDQVSIMSTSTYQSALSEDAPSIFDSGSSIRSFSDTASITSSIISVSSKLLGRRSGSSSAQAAAVAQAQAQAAHAQAAATWDDGEARPASPTQESVAPADSAPTTAAAPASTAPKQKASFKCGFCDEESIPKTCTRKNDLKRHIEDFHNMNAQWFCRHRNCQKVFDWQTAYKQHLKTAHGGSRMSLDEAKVNLCPQVVFACGFEKCPQVFEAPGDAEAPQTFKEYVSHVVKHFDEGAQSGEWSYTTRIRNLLRQAQVNAAWTESGWADAAMDQLQWTPQTSGVLRKRLECRHIGDVKLLVHYAIQLGTDPRSIQKFSPDFIPPLKDSCTMSGPGHVARKAPVATEQPDQFQYRISRGSNPALAQYINAQRRICVPRHPSARRPHHPHPHPSRSSLPQNVPTSNPMGTMNAHSQMQHYFTTMAEAAPPNSPLYDSPPQAFSPTASMMSATGGIIADDLRNLRSIANGSPEPDIDMTDSPTLVGSEFSAPYAAAGLQSPCAVDGPMSSPVGMEHNTGFYHDDQQIAHHPHAY